MRNDSSSAGGRRVIITLKRWVGYRVLLARSHADVFSCCTCHMRSFIQTTASRRGTAVKLQTVLCTRRLQIDRRCLKSTHAQKEYRYGVCNDSSSVDGGRVIRTLKRWDRGFILHGIMQMFSLVLHASRWPARLVLGAMAHNMDPEQNLCTVHRRMEPTHKRVHTLTYKRTHSRTDSTFQVSDGLEL